MSDPASSQSSVWATFGAAVGGFLIFGLILLIAYLPKTPPPLPEGSRTPQQRADALAELRAKETKAAGAYTWIDQANGVVQLPIERAMELTLQDLSARK